MRVPSYLIDDIMPSLISIAVNNIFNRIYCNMAVMWHFINIWWTIIHDKIRHVVIFLFLNLIAFIFLPKLQDIFFQLRKIGTFLN